MPAHTIKGGVPHRDGSWQPGWKGERMSKDWKPSDHIAVVLTKCEVYKGSGDVYVKVTKDEPERLETIRKFQVDTGYSRDTYEIITGTGTIVSKVEDWIGGRRRETNKEYHLKGRIRYKVDVADEINRSRWSEYVRIPGKGLCSTYVGFEIVEYEYLYQGKFWPGSEVRIYVPGKWKLFDTDEKKLSAKIVVAYLLNGSIKVPNAEFPFEIFGCRFDIPKGLENESYFHYASGTYQNWTKLHCNDSAPENCKNDDISQTYFYVTDGKDTYLLRRWWINKGYLLTLVMPESQYGALIASNGGENKMLYRIKMKEQSYLNEDWPGYMIDKIEYDDFWYAVRVLPDGRYLLEEWSDSSTENDRWVLESVDECYNKAYELSGVPGQFYIGQEVDYWVMPGESLGSIDSDHSLLTFKLLYDSETNQYFVVSDDTSGKDEMFILESFGTAEETLAWLETAEIPEKTAKILTMLIEENEK